MQGEAVQALVGRSLLGRLYLADVQGRIPANELLRWQQLNQLNQVKLDGYLDFDFEEVQLSETGVPAGAAGNCRYPVWRERGIG